MSLRVATRGSELARWQARRVADRLGIPTELVIVSTTGDERADVPLHEMGGTGVFVKEVQAAVLDGRADLAVHSAKDLPAVTVDGLDLASVPERADPHDALVGAALDEIPSGGRIGSDSVRRRAQLAAFRPDLGFGSLRGNIATRLEKAAGFDAVVVALAALDRLGLSGRVAEVLDPHVVLPQVGQGALAVECRTGDATVRAALEAIDDPDAHRAVVAERAFLESLGGGCDLPCAALARVDGEEIVIEVLLASLDGRIVLRAGARGRDARALGIEAARRLLDEAGGRLLLEDA